jgi:hypothetical protein
VLLKTAFCCATSGPESLRRFFLCAACGASATHISPPSFSLDPEVSRAHSFGSSLGESVKSNSEKKSGTNGAQSGRPNVQDVASSVANPGSHRALSSAPVPSAPGKMHQSFSQDSVCAPPLVPDSRSPSTPSLPNFPLTPGCSPEQKVKIAFDSPTNSQSTPVCSCSCPALHRDAVASPSLYATFRDVSLNSPPPPVLPYGPFPPQDYRSGYRSFAMKAPSHLQFCERDASFVPRSADRFSVPLPVDDSLPLDQLPSLPMASVYTFEQRHWDHRPAALGPPILAQVQPGYNPVPLPFPQHRPPIAWSNDKWPVLRLDNVGFSFAYFFLTRVTRVVR